MIIWDCRIILSIFIHFHANYYAIKLVVSVAGVDVGSGPRTKMGTGTKFGTAAQSP